MPGLGGPGERDDATDYALDRDRPEEAAVAALVAVVAEEKDVAGRDRNGAKGPGDCPGGKQQDVVSNGARLSVADLGGFAVRLRWSLNPSKRLWKPVEIHHLVAYFDRFACDGYYARDKQAAGTVRRLKEDDVAGCRRNGLEETKRREREAVLERTLQNEKGGARRQGGTHGVGRHGTPIDSDGSDDQKENDQEP